MDTPNGDRYIRLLIAEYEDVLRSLRLRIAMDTDSLNRYDYSALHALEIEYRIALDKKAVAHYEEILNRLLKGRTSSGTPQMDKIDCTTVL